jgi:hypothetical protein
MSYLNALRLHFAGRFQANVSTVNNDAGHFENATFKPEYQQMSGVNFLAQANGWFNPEGDAAWRLLGCTVTSAFAPDGAVPASDPVLACIVADSDTQPPAKLCDLDPEQQLVSEIWGLQVRIADGKGNTLLRGDFDPAAFIDIWDRATVSSGGDADAGASYQSVLRNLQWGDVSGSPFLLALQAAAADGLLSIKFNVDSFNLDYTSPKFMTGRITGTIGPTSAAEPAHLVLGRQFMAVQAPGGNFFVPAGGINFCVARVDQTAGLVYLDLGNALQTGADGTMVNIGDVQLGVYDPILTPPNPAGSIIPIGTVTAATYTAVDWYANTAGVVVMTVDPLLMPRVQSSPLTLSSTQGNAITESNTGMFVRADRFVYRASPSDSVTMQVYATCYGAPVAQGTVISFSADNSQLQPGNMVNPLDVPPVGTPLAAIGYADPPAPPIVFTANTDANGQASLTLTMQNPGTPRWFNQGADFGIDGQVYGVRPSFQNTTDNGVINPWNFVSILLWSEYQTQTPIPTWYADLQPIFQQYANLYPVMNRFLNLADYNDVVANRRLLQLAFGLDPANPNSMPVTRDLSAAKRQAILTWLAQPTPPLGTPPAPAPKVAPKAVAAAPQVANESESEPAVPAKPTPPRGKASAIARRLVNLTP